MSEAPTKRAKARAESQTIRFQTETGSVYEISRDVDGMRWRRLSATLASGTLRSDGASLLSWPDVRVGDRCVLPSEPFVPPFPRVVWTSEVVAILEHQVPMQVREQARERQVAGVPDSFRAIGVGDTVTRLLAGSVPMTLVVTGVDERFIHCGGPGGWKFDRSTGIEVDEELGWGPQFGISGSYLVPQGEEAT